MGCGMTTRLPIPVLSQEVTAKIDMEQVRAFAVASGDFNPVHTSVEAAQAAGLAGPVLHGMIIAGRFEAFLERLADYTIAELHVRFVRPVPVGSVLTISARSLGSSDHEIHLRLLAKEEGSGLAAIAEARLRPISQPPQ